MSWGQYGQQLHHVLEVALLPAVCQPPHVALTHQRNAPGHAMHP